MEGTARKITRKEKPGVSKNDGAAQSYDRNTLDSNVYLTYDILRIIFQYLNAKDLGSAAMVCRSWLEAANNEKWTRGPYCFIQNDYTHCDFSHNVNNIRVKPSAGFFFIPCGSPSNKQVEQAALVGYSLFSFQCGVKKTNWPEHCKVIMLYSEGIIKDNDEMECNPSMVCAFLPQIPNVKIKLFESLEEIISTIVEYETSISNHETSTCFMLFCNYKGRKTAKHWASVVQQRKEDKIVSVWGGVVKEIYVHTYNTKEESSHKMDVPYCVAVLITGPIQTWSTILDKECDTKERAEAKLKLFRDEVKLKKHSIGFMFVCRREMYHSKRFVVRGHRMYNESNVESTIFKRLFPKVPLAGCFGYGEFGKNTIVDEVNEEKNDKEERKKRKKSKSWYNECSTVFLIITYG